MKKLIAAILAACCLTTSVLPALASYSVPEAYMGFSVSDDWFIFSKNMKNDTLLDAVDMTVGEVNEALVSSDCEYFITNPTKKAEIYVKVKKNPVADEFYNISGTEDAILQAELDRILKDGFSVDQFTYLPEAVRITSFVQMKFVTIPGTVTYDGNNVGMVFGFTFVNGNGIAFMMRVNSTAPTEEDIQTVLDIANTVSFTVVKDKGEETPAPENETETEKADSPKPLPYIAGGFAALLLAAACLYLIPRIKRQSVDPEMENDEYDETDDDTLD